jgi:hypothetical protein
LITSIAGRDPGTLGSSGKSRLSSATLAKALPSPIYLAISLRPDGSKGEL